MGSENVEITLGSLFDGIGGFPLCAEWNGIVPLWASEIEKVPIEITKKHFPDMKHLGDITKIDGAKIEPVDVITFGSPCQDLSIAGKRKGLEGERSGLFKSAVNIIRKMQSSTGGQYPRYAVWENVPGAFSSNKGLDFRTVLEEITKTEIPMPSGGKWAEAGMVECPNCQVAWRTMDAQFWGVPQRRKRIYLVADFRGKSAAEILFECKSLPRNIEESQDQRESITANSGTGIKATSENVSFTLNTIDRHAVCFEPGKAKRLGENIYENKSRTLRANMGDNQFAVAYAVENHAADSRCKFSSGNKIQTLSTRMGTGGNNVPLVMAQQSYSEFSQTKQAGTLKSSGGSYGGGSENLVVQANYIVRRLTPLECERLQAFPDKWTDGFADALRYKALGNSLALVNANFVISRIAKKLSSQALFDK